MYKIIVKLYPDEFKSEEKIMVPQIEVSNNSEGYSNYLINNIEDIPEFIPNTSSISFPITNTLPFYTSNIINNSRNNSNFL